MSLPGEIHWPKKTQQASHPFLDSTRWDEFPFRDDDIVIATWAKSGSTWLQQIVGQLIFEGPEGGIDVYAIAPWVDMRMAPKEELFETLEAQTHRRFVRTHLPVESLVFSPKAKYLYIARDGRDVLWSLYNHHINLTQEVIDQANALPGMEEHPAAPPPTDVRAFYHDWLDRDGYPLFPYWSHIRSWWDIRDLPNVRLLHFNNLKADLPGEMRRIANFLAIEVDEALWPVLVEHCTFDYMKEHASEVIAKIEWFWEGGGKTFIHKGTNGRWRDVLIPADIRKYEAAVKENLAPDCVSWLATGQLPE